MFDQLKMMKQAYEMQKKLKEIIISTEYNGIKISMNGKQDVLSVEISENLLSNKSNLEKSVQQAVNNAIAQSQKESAEKMKGEMGSLLGM